jgi:hypothetical protein
MPGRSPLHTKEDMWAWPNETQQQNAEKTAATGLTPSAVGGPTATEEPHERHDQNPMV